MREVLTKEQIYESSPKLWANFRNYNKIVVSIGIHLIRLFFNKVIKKLLESNRVILPSKLGDKVQHEMYITDVQQSHKKYLNSHTGGKVYNVVITGFNPPVSVKLGVEYKQELKTRLEDGQSFY